MDFQMVPLFDEQNNCWQVSLSGEIDIFNSSEMKLRFNELLEEKAADLRVCCADLEYIDSTGLGALVSVYKTVNQHEKQMFLYSVKQNILKLFRITSLDKVFIIEDGGEND